VARFIDTLILQGKIPWRRQRSEDQSRSVQWTAPRFESVDPVKDAEAVLKDVRMGRKTWFEAVLENGYDPTTQLQQIALFNKLVDKFEIILDVDPRNVTLRGQEQPANTEERTPTSKPVGGHPAARASQALSEEDLAMVKELLVAGMSRETSELAIHNPALPGINPLNQKEETPMKGKSGGNGRLQEAITIEASLMLQYLLDQRDLKRLGLDLADGSSNCTSSAKTT
jgi:hypothetical protein